MLWAGLLSASAAPVSSVWREAEKWQIMTGLIMNAYCNDTAREFLSDVSKLCSDDGEIRDDEEEESHIAVLVDYLMNGQGCLLLATLNKTVDQGLTCREELMTLILSLIPLVWKIPVEEEQAGEYNLFSNGLEAYTASEMVHIPHKNVVNEETAHFDFLQNSKTLLKNKPRRQPKGMCRHSMKDDRRSLSSSDSETTIQDNSSSSLVKQRKLFEKSMTIHIGEPKRAEKSSQHKKGGPFPELVSAISQMSTEMKQLEETTSISNKKASAFNLCQILLSLLEKVCQFDIILNHTSALSSCIIPTLTEYISEISDYHAPGKGTLEKGWTEEPVALIQRMLLHTVLSLLTVEISEKDVMPDNLRKNLSDLLRTSLKLKSYSTKMLDSHQQLLQDTVDNINLYSSQHQAFFFPDLLEGIFQIIYLCLKGAATNSLYFSQCIELFHDFIHYSGFNILENAVLQMESLGLQHEHLHSQASNHVMILISSVLKIVSLIKKVKSDQLHQSMCTRKRHRRCEFSHFMHHHRDLSGLPISLFRNDNLDESMCGEISYPERSCCIAVCSYHCLRLLQRVSVTTSCLHILLGIQNAGICCCMDPLSVIKPLLYAFKVPTLKNMQHHILSILAHFLLNQLGGGKISSVVKQASCNMCVMDNDHLTELKDTFQGRAETTPLAGIPYRLQGVLPCVGSEDTTWKWNSFEAYQELVFSSDLQLSLHVSSHICNLMQEGNAVVQQKLYTLIFNGILQRGVEMVHHCQQSGISTLSSQPGFIQKSYLLHVLKVYLKDLPELLKSRAVRESFLNSNGLNQVTELIYLDPLRDFCLKVFQTLICFGDQQTDLLAPTTDISENDPNTLASEFFVQPLKPDEYINVSQSLSKFYGVLRDTCPKKRKDIDQKISTINLFLCLAFLSVSKDAESDLELVNESEDTSGYDSTASEPLNILPKLNAESLFLPSPQQIQQTADIWAMCSWLYLKCSMFQKQFHKIGGFDLCYKLVHMMIKNFHSFEDFSAVTLKSPHSETLGMEENSGMASRVREETLITSPDSVTMYHQSRLADSKDHLLSTWKNYAQDWSSGAGKLFEALLSICLHSARNSQLKSELESSQHIPIQHIMLEIQESLSHSRFETKHLSQIFDSLMQVAVSNFPLICDSYEEQSEKTQKTEEMVLQHGDVSEDPDESHMCKLGIFGEEKGYEADSESNPEDVSEDNEVKTELEESGSINDQLDMFNSGELLYPEICAVVLNLLSGYHTNTTLVNRVFHTLLKILKMKKKNILLLIQQGTTKSLLNGLQFLFTSTDSGLLECHEVLIDILVTLMSHSINSDDLALLLRCFLENTLPDELLIKGILKITEASNGMIPLKHLTFPLQQNLVGASGVAQKSPGFTSSKISGFCRKTKTWQNKDVHCENSLSPWHIAPIHLHLVGQNCWPHMSDGFSLSLWLKLECNQDLDTLVRVKQGKKKNKFPFQAQSTVADKTVGADYFTCDRLLDDGCIHVLSLGSKVLMMQIWFNMVSGRFTFRLCSSSSDEYKWTSLAQVETHDNILHPGNWQHLAFTCKEVFESKNKVCSKIMLWVSGQRTTEVTLEYNPPRKGNLSSDSNRTFCMIGHNMSSQEDNIPCGGQLCLGNLLLFNGPILGIEEAFHLYCRGPDLTSLMTCKHGMVTIDHCKYISKEILQNEKIHDFLIKNKEMDLSSLSENLAVVYDMENPATYTIYEPVIRMKGSLKTTVSQRPFSTKEVSSKSLDSQALKMLNPCHEKNIHSVLHEIGGIGAIVFLFARIVEISCCEKTQSLGLKIILSLIKYNQQRIQESENSDIYPMIHQVLIQPKCIVGFHILKTILKGCTDDWLLNISDNASVCLNYETTAVIQDVRLLEHLLLDWKIWSKAKVGVWETLMTCLEILIRDNHPYKLFNIKQLLKARVVHHFLLACQVLQEHREGYITSIPRDVCGSYIKIIEEVLGSPPELDLLKLIFSFLLAVHPPTNTFVCHNPNNFFFSLHIDDKIFQEKLKSVINQRHFSVGEQSTTSPVFSSKGAETSLFSSQQHIHLSVVERSRSKSLPTSPSFSPKVLPKRLGGSLSKSIVDLKKSTDSEQAMADGFCKSDHRLEVLKTVEDQNISSCESAQTVCESGMLPECITITEPPKEDLDQFALHQSSKQTFQDVIEDTVLQRPDKLKGICSSRKGQSNMASISLAFPSIGSLPSWGDVPEKKKSEEWVGFSFSPVFGLTNVEPVNMEERSVDECMHLVCCGLYSLLCGVLITMPDFMVAEVFNEIIQADVLIVLVNHPCSQIQQGVLKLLNAYFHRASKEEKEAFLKKSGFSLLANQLYLHQGSQEVLECLLEMFFGRHIGLDEEFDVDEIKTTNIFRKWCIIPVLGLIENSLHDASLLHNSFCILLQIINSCSKVADMLLDSGLLYALCNTLATLCGIETSVSPDEYILLACDLQQLLIAVTIHSCSSSGSQYFRIVEDLIVILGYLNESKNEKLQNMAVVMQFKIIHSAIEFIKTTSNQDTQAVSTTYNFPQSSHGKYPKRKSTAGTQRLSFAQSDPLLITMRSFASSELTELMHRRMSQENQIRASESEFVQRLQRLTVLAVNRLIYQDMEEEKGDSELNLEPTEEELQLNVSHVKNEFQNELLRILIEGIMLSVGSGRTSSPKQQWKTLIHLCTDTFRVQLGRLLAHLLSPSQQTENRRKVLQIVTEPRHQAILTECLSPGLQHGPKMALYLFELMYNHKEDLTKEDHTMGALLMNALNETGYKCIPPHAPLKLDLLKASEEEQRKYKSEDLANKAAWKKTIANNQQKLFQRLESKLKEISKIAGDITQNISLSQGMERKNVIQHIRNMYKVDLSASRHWQELVQQMTHDRAVWYDPASYPTSFQLDPTEGPNRERRRLQKCYLTIPNKYILRDRQRQEESIKPPLSYFFEDKTHYSLSSTVKEKAASELIRVNRRCINVAPSSETIGELLLGKTGMYFVEDSSTDTLESNPLLGDSEPASFSWTYEEIKEVHKRWWQLRDNAVEIFLTNGRTLLLAFDNTKVRDDVYQKILTNNLPNLLEYGNITALTQLWCSGQITNFEYLTHLNKHAGRSFNDLMQYPVFPFILSDYTSETLDLSTTLIYRNLVKPIAVQSKEKEDRYIDNYKYLEDEYSKADREDDPMPPVQPYHYGSHYSNSGTVLHFLVRLPPFTKMFLAYQDQSFDIPDRTFHSMNTTWRLSSFESMTDVKELIPEFFYLPEFLVNREGFDFGLRQNGERVNHVNLPPWARNDPRLFILIHRQALESDNVSQTICHWIDLVFGYKQKGRAAVQAINVFHPATYFGMDVSAVEDPVQRRALETMIKTYGQTPRQLFHSAHVSRSGSKLLLEGELPAAMGLLVHFAFRENKESTKEPTYPSPLPWIRGLKWGEYVGSPSAPDPTVCFSQPHGERFGSLQALPTRAICGLSRKFCLMMSYSKEQGVRSMHSTDIQWSAILSWGYPDNILRLKSKQSEPPVNFIQCSKLHQVTSCAWVPDSCQLYTGSKCGVITAYLNRFTNTTPMEIEVESQVQLYGHSGEITCLFVCKPYSILISVSMDGTCIIWDLNRLCYVQSLTGHKSPVTAVSASETTGDIATVCDSVGGGSDLRLWTVNGDLIGHVHCREIISCVAFSNQPEGVSVNVVAGGLENGVVRLWSTWDLKPVREITFPKSNKPIVSLTFSCDGHHLYTANSEGTVIGWCRKDQQRLKLPMFYSFLSNYSAC
ncbi:lysosomal-trafficking regulator isoform X3 [Hyla sarda]|uniref:lysosomal-trafficking regulator isoform X3 n=1 Tax=Hyla sarda TaxID=327740 RepID=UPI0024C30E8E|nr:lysosomal-trafficking regulator isoform X3 [Hyla sarda]